MIPEKIVSTLKNIGEDDKLLGRNVLLELGQKTGVDFNKTVANAMETSAQLKSPRAMEALRRAQPQIAEVERLQQEQRQLQNPAARANRIEAQVAAHPASRSLEIAQGHVDEAEEMMAELKSWNENTIDGKVKSIMSGKENLRRQVQRLGSLTDQDFETAIDDLRTLRTFDKSFRHGSMNTNSWALMVTPFFIEECMKLNSPFGLVSVTMPTWPTIPL